MIEKVVKLKVTRYSRVILKLIIKLLFLVYILLLKTLENTLELVK